MPHTYQHTGPINVAVRIISAREATKRERLQYENEPSYNNFAKVTTMNTQTTPIDDDMPAEIDFSGAKRGYFYKPGVQLNLPVYLDQKVQATLAALANAKGVDFSVLINDLLKKDIELIEMAR